MGRRMDRVPLTGFLAVRERFKVRPSLGWVPTKVCESCYPKMVRDGSNSGPEPVDESRIQDRRAFCDRRRIGMKFRTFPVLRAPYCLPKTSPRAAQRSPVLVFVVTVENEKSADEPVVNCHARRWAVEQNKNALLDTQEHTKKSIE